MTANVEFNFCYQKLGVQIMKTLSLIVLSVLLWMPNFCFSMECTPKYLESETIKEISLLREQRKDIILSNLKIGNYHKDEYIIILTNFNIKYLNEGLELEMVILDYYNKNSCEWIKSESSEIRPIPFEN